MKVKGQFLILFSVFFTYFFLITLFYSINYPRNIDLQKEDLSIFSYLSSSYDNFCKKVGKISISPFETALAIESNANFSNYLSYKVDKYLVVYDNFSSPIYLYSCNGKSNVQEEIYFNNCSNFIEIYSNSYFVNFSKEHGNFSLRLYNSSFTNFSFSIDCDGSSYESDISKVEIKYSPILLIVETYGTIGSSTFFREYFFFPDRIEVRDNYSISCSSFNYSVIENSSFTHYKDSEGNEGNVEVTTTPSWHYLKDDYLVGCFYENLSKLYYFTNGNLKMIFSTSPSINSSSLTIVTREVESYYNFFSNLNKSIVNEYSDILSDVEIMSKYLKFSYIKCKEKEFSNTKSEVHLKENPSSYIVASIPVKNNSYVDKIIALTNVTIPNVNSSHENLFYIYSPYGNDKIYCSNCNLTIIYPNSTSFTIKASLFNLPLQGMYEVKVNEANSSFTSTSPFLLIKKLYTLKPGYFYIKDLQASSPCNFKVYDGRNKLFEISTSKLQGKYKVYYDCQNYFTFNEPATLYNFSPYFYESYLEVPAYIFANEKNVKLRFDEESNESLIYNESEKRISNDYFTWDLDNNTLKVFPYEGNYFNNDTYFIYTCYDYPECSESKKLINFNLIENRSNFKVIRGESEDGNLTFYFFFTNSPIVGIYVKEKEIKPYKIRLYLSVNGSNDEFAYLNGNESFPLVASFSSLRNVGYKGKDDIIAITFPKTFIDERSVVLNKTYIELSFVGDKLFYLYFLKKGVYDYLKNNINFVSVNKVISCNFTISSNKKIIKGEIS